MNQKLINHKSQIDKSLSYSSEFQYKHRNPYHDKLKDFSDFVLRDLEGESLKSNWRDKAFQSDESTFINVEIGSGYGQFMIDFSQDHPKEKFVGIDYRFKRSFQLAKKLSQLKNQNFKYLRAKGERLSFLFGENEVDRMFYFFPDPWPKIRHHKKRLFQKPFLRDCTKVLKPQGQLFIKTDHDEYFQWMLETLEQNKDLGFKVVSKTFDLHEDKDQNFHIMQKYQTKFEKLFRSQGTKIKALVVNAN